MAAVNLEQGVRVWEIDLGGVQTPWAAEDYIFVLTNDSQVVAVRREDGRIRWVGLLQRFEDPEDQEEPIRWYGPVLAGERLIVAGSHAFGAQAHLIDRFLAGDIAAGAIW